LSRYIPVGTECDHCDKTDLKWIYRYHEKIYCHQCFNEHFEIRECSKCGENKYIWYQLKETPLCKVCEIKDDPCIRCGREIEHFGKIMNEGPVCASCSKYFRDKKQCMVCFKYSREVANRSIDGSSQPTCTSCYNKTLPTCSGCQRKRESYSCDEEGRSLCKKCSEGNRVCLSCENTFPAGRGRICQECSSRNGLIKKVELAKDTLSSYFNGHFEGFALWLSKKRGPQFASHRILYFFEWFKKLDKLAISLGRMPVYADVVSTFSVAETRQYLLATRYLDENNIIAIDKKAQKIHADMDMIDRYLTALPRKSYHAEVISSYHLYLQERLSAGKTSVRGMRLAMTPAVRFFQYCLYDPEEVPLQKLLEGYLWCYYGQKSAITGFVLFLNRDFGYSLSVKDIYRPVFERPKSSHKYLEQRFLSFLRDRHQMKEKDYEEFLRIAIGYLHGIDILKHIKIGFCDIKKSGEGYQIRFGGEVFVLPEEIVDSTPSSEQC